MTTVSDMPGTPTGTSRWAYFLWLVWAVWLAFLIQPIAGLFHEAHPLPQLIVILFALAVFIATYIWVAVQTSRRLTAPSQFTAAPSILWGPLILLALISIALSFYAGNTWLILFIYTSTSVGGRFSNKRAMFVTAGITVLALVCGWLTGSSWLYFGQGAFIIIAASSLTIYLTWALRTNLELRAAREELARLAITEERLRIARDLHDILGHNLSLIALKSELARRLVANDPERATREILDIESVARSSLNEAREAISAYRQPTLATELHGAQEMLTAAGIGYTFDTHSLAIPTALEAVLAWTIREGVTNVIRHSHARHCSIRLDSDSQGISASITDNGKHHSAAAEQENSGKGLRGLAERVAAHHGEFAAGPEPSGGFSLSVKLPLKMTIQEQAEAVLPSGKPQKREG